MKVYLVVTQPEESTGNKPVYVSVVSPFTDPDIRYTTKKNDALFYLHSELSAVEQALNKRKIPYKVVQK